MIVLLCYVLPLCILLAFPLSWLESGGRWKGLLPVVLCALLAAYGCFAFFAQGGGLRFVGESFEWPLMSTAGAVENARGQRFVPVTAPGRIQVYDRDGEFVRGWFIPAAGGGFKLHVTQDDNLEVFTIRGDRRLVFAADGTLLSDGEYRQNYDQLPTGPDGRVDRMGPWYLWPLANPFLAMFPSIVGLAGLAVLFNHPRLRGHRRPRCVSRSSTSMVSSAGPGEFSVMVGMMPQPSCTDSTNAPSGHASCKVSERLGLDTSNSDCLQNPPAGAWYTKETRGFSLGASTRSPTAFFLVPFACVWSGGALATSYGSQIVSGEFNVILSVFGVPFVLASAALWMIALMTVWGKVVVTVDNDEGTAFVGIGSFGWTRSFDWSGVSLIREEGSGIRYPNSSMECILLEGTTRLKFASNLTERRRDYIFNALQYLKARSG